MAVTQHCTYCGLWFRVGQIIYESEKHAERDDLLYYQVCQHCGTQHLNHSYHYFSPQETGVLLAKSQPHFERVTEEEYTDWQRFSAKVQQAEARSRTLTKMPVKWWFGLMILFSPLLLLMGIYRGLCWHCRFRYASRKGQWSIPEFDEKWEEAARWQGRLRYDWQCHYCHRTDGLTNNPLSVCPHCNKEATFYYKDQHDYILRNGRPLWLTNK